MPAGGRQLFVQLGKVYFLASKGASAQNSNPEEGSPDDEASRVIAFNRNGDQIQVYSAGAAELITIEVSGGILYTADSSGQVKAFNVKSGQEIFTFADHTGKAVTALTVEGLTGYSGDASGRIYSWSSKTGKRKDHFSGPKGEVSCITKEKKLLYASSGKDIAVWDASSAEKRWVYEGHTGQIVALDVQNKRVYSASEDKTLRIWDSGSETLINVCKGHKKALTDLWVDTKNNFVFSAAKDGTARAWNPDTAESVREFDLPTKVKKTYITSIRGDGKTRIWTAATDKKVYEWDTESGSALQKFEGHPEIPHSVYPGEGNTIYSADKTTARKWDRSTGITQVNMDGSVSEINQIVVAQDNFAISYHQKNIVKIMERTEGAVLGVLTHLHPVNTMCYHRDVLFTGTNGNGKVTAYDIKSNKRLHTFDTKSSAVHSIFGHKNTIYVGTSDSISRFTIGKVDWTPGSNKFKAGKVTRTFQQPPYHGGPNPVTAICLSKDGKFMFAGDASGMVRVQRMSAIGKIYKEFQNSEDFAVSSLVFDWRQKLLLVGTAKESIVNAWDLATETIEWTWKPKIDAGAINDIYPLEFRRILVAASDSTVKVLDANDGEQLHAFPGFRAPVRSFATSSNKEVYVAASDVFTINTERLVKRGVLEQHRHVPTETFIERTGATYSNTISYGLAWIFLAVEFVQMTSFGFVKPGDWGPLDSLADTLNTLRTVGERYDPADPTSRISLTTGGIFGFMLAFVLQFFFQELVEDRKFTNPRSGFWRSAWLSLVGLTKFAVGPLLIPALSLVTYQWDCRRYETGCTGEGSTFWIQIGTAVLGLFYIPLAFRVLKVGGELVNIDARLNPLDWRGDAFVPPDGHPLSASAVRPRFATIVFIAKLALVISQVLPEGTAPLLVIQIGIGALLVINSIASPPYLRQWGNNLRRTVDMAILWAFVSAYLQNASRFAGTLFGSIMYVTVLIIQTFLVYKIQGRFTAKKKREEKEDEGENDPDPDGKPEGEESGSDDDDAGSGSDAGPDEPSPTPPPEPTPPPVPSPPPNDGPGDDVSDSSEDDEPEESGRGRGGDGRGGDDRGDSDDDGGRGRAGGGSRSGGADSDNERGSDNGTGTGAVKEEDFGAPTGEFADDTDSD